MAEYISDELFHFVGQRAPLAHEQNFDTLLKIINSGCVSSDPPKVGWGSTTVQLKRGARLEAEELAVSNITCYCDIPSGALGLHVAKYGSFGLSFSRHLLIKYGARPVLYVPMQAADWGAPYGKTLLRDVQAVFEGFMTQLYEPIARDLKAQSRSLTHIPATSLEAVEALHSVLLKDFLAYIKPYDSELTEAHQRYFYAEREWRRIGGLMFSLSDVKTIAIADGYEPRLRTAVPDFRGNVLVIPTPASSSPGDA